MSKISIKQSLIQIKKEKLSIMLKEILHLRYILNYYSLKPKNRDSSSDTKQTIESANIKEDMSTAEESLISVKESLKEVYDIIKILDNYINSDKDTQEENLYFIILQDYIGKTINNTLHTIELIYKKIYQIFEESYNQYIPKPTLGRRFSNNNLVSTLKSHYEKIINSLGVAKSKLILSWSYKNYMSLEYSQYELNRYNSTKSYETFINLPYWYYELPTLLPSITHACIKIVLTQKDSKIREQKEQIEKDIKSYSINLQNNLLIADKILDKDIALTDKIIADITAFAIHGNAYIYSLFHETIGIGMAELFDISLKKDIVPKGATTPISEYMEECFEYRVLPYKFNPLRDISAIRLHVLLSFAIETDSYILEMKKLLNSILNTNNMSMVSKLYNKNHPHYKDYYNIYNEVAIDIIEAYKSAIEHSNIIYEIKSIFKGVKTTNFNQLWEKHLNDGYVHKNEFRKILHEQTKINLEKIINKDLDKLGWGEPYSMRFVKIHKSIDCTLKDKNSKDNCFDKKINHYFENYYHSFGIYDLLLIYSTKNLYENIDVIIEQKFEKFNDKLELRYYESRFALMKIYPTIEASGNSNNDTKQYVSIMYNIDLNFPIDEERYQFLANAIDTIAETIKTESQNFCDDSKSNENASIEKKFSKANIYKSLGPGDLIVIIDGVPEDNFLQFSQYIVALKEVKRTFTTVLTKDKESLEPGEEYNIVSYVRLALDEEETLDSKINNILDKYYKEDIGNRDKIEKVYITSGVLDLEIIWNNTATTKDVINFYELCMRERVIKDFQTKFNKKYPL